MTCCHCCARLTADPPPSLLPFPPSSHIHLLNDQFALCYTLVEEKFACVDYTTGPHRRADEDNPNLRALQIFPQRDLLLTTTVMLVILTVFIQGTLAGYVTLSSLRLGFFPPF